MLIYLGPIVVFLAALVAVKGGTWNEAAHGTKKITPTGWAAIFVSVVGLITSFCSVYSSAEYQRNLLNKLDLSEKKLSKANTNLEELKIKLGSSEKNLQEASDKIARIQGELNDANRRLNRVYVEIESRYVDLSNKREETLHALAGSIVKTYGFSCPVEVVTDFSSHTLSAGEQKEIPLVGPPGRTMTIRFRKLIKQHRTFGTPIPSVSYCGGKVIIRGIDH